MGNITELSQGNLDGLKKQVCECIDHANAEGYKRGYTKGKNDGHAQGCNTQSEYDKAKIDEAKQDGYNNGYDTAINDYNVMIQRLHESRNDFISFLAEVYLYNLEGDMTTGSILYDIIPKWNMRELIYEFKEWQEQKKQAEEEIKVGDIVVWKDGREDFPFIITLVKSQTYVALNKEGGFTHFTPNAKLKKIGSVSDKLQALFEDLEG